MCWDDLSVEEDAHWDFPKCPYLVPILLNGMGSDCYLMAYTLVAETDSTFYLMVAQFLDHLPAEF